MTRRAVVAVLIASLLSSSGCTVPNFEGPQIQEPPRGFFLQPESFQARSIFPDVEPAFHTAWVHTDVSGVSVIYVDGYAGVLDVNDVSRALDGAMAAATDPDRSFSNIEVLTIDGRPGWGWAERVESDARGLVDVAYRAVIPYDTITYAIEFMSGEPNWKSNAPDTLRAVISTFAVGRTTWNTPVIAIIVGLILFAVSALRTRAKRRDQRLRGINLVKIEKPSEDKAVEAVLEEEAATGGPPPRGSA